MTYRRVCLLLMVLLASPCLSHANGGDADPDATAKAFRALLASSNAQIDMHSSCFGQYGQQGAPTVKDLVAVELASLYTGTNIIVGHCDGSRCDISIAHDAGEDVSSARIRFSTKHGRAVAYTLECVMTP